MEQIETIMRERNIEIINNEKLVQKITSNKTTTEYINDYIKVAKLPNKVFDQINHIRLFKRAVIPVELTRARGQRTTECYDKIEVKSMLEQNINFLEIQKPTIKAVQAWDYFKE